ncbi:MAG: hypothetical protein H0U67_10220 [Gemmatimonadetes bacterium]|nr:hypothetical protein [Gemmatimonadota bacterium]
MQGYMLLSGMLIVLGACSPAGHSGASPISSPPVQQVIPSYEDTAAFRQAAQATVQEFATRVKELGTDLGAVPTVEVRTTPMLIYFDGAAGKIVAPWWSDFGPEQRALFAHFAGGDDAAGERLFRAFFHRFFVPHEAAHWYQRQTGTREATLYANEQAANRLAVAFWRTQPDGEAFLSEMERMLVGLVQRIPDPTPPGEDPVTYFGANYRTLAQAPMKYGYYQFRFVLEALRERKTLELPTLVRRTAASTP